MKVIRTRRFLKDYKRPPSNIRKKTDKNLLLLLNDLRHPSLRVKKMSGVGNVWEGHVDKHYVFTFQVDEDILILRRVELHSVYKKP